MHALDDAIEAAGGVGKLAKALGIRQSAVSNWRMRGGRVPAERCPAIESAVHGQVTRYALRPDIFGTEPNKAA